MSDASLIKNAQAAVDRALKLKLVGDLDEARRHLADFDTRSASPETSDGRRAIAEVQFTLGELNEKVGDAGAARAAFEAALELDPQHRRACQKVVEAALTGSTSSDPALAPRLIDYLSWGTDRKLKRLCLHRLRDMLRIPLDANGASVSWQIPLLQSLNESWPTLAFPRIYLARGHYVRGEFRQAIPYLREAVSLTPRNTSLLNLLARAYEKVGHLEVARDTYRQSLAESGAQPGVHFRLGRILLYVAARRAPLA